MTATSASHHHDDGRSVAGETETSSIVHVEIMSNADLYTMTPPAYTASAADGEESIDAEAYQPEKSRRPSTPHTKETNPNPYAMARSPSQTSSFTQAGPSNSSPYPNELPPDYFTELTDNAAAAHTKRCSIIPERPATWLVKRNKMALCPLVATVLIKEGLLRSKELELVSRSSGVKRDPTDPLSAVAFGVYDTVGDILLGLVEGPVELGRQVAPMMHKYEAKQHGEQKDEPKQSGDLAPHVRHSVRQESAPLRPGTPRSVCSTVQEGGDGEAQMHLRPGSSHGFEQAKCYSDVEQKKETSLSQAGKQVAIGTSKGFGRIVGAGVKAPMTFTHGLTRGFHNAPKLYGEEVREYENVTDLKSGLLVSGKGFAHGLSDGLKDFFVKPVQGAQKEGVIGFGKGFGKGIGNLVFKPTAGAIGLVGYSSVGVYKQIQSINFGRKDAAVEVVMKLGEAEFEQASDMVKLEVVKQWCVVMMRAK